MKKNKLFLPKMILLFGVVLMVLVNIFVCIAKEPAVQEQSFPFSITYKIGGETKTIEDEYICTYTGPGQSVDPRDRFYEGVYANRTEEVTCGDYLIQAYDDGELVIFTNFDASYMMGDATYEGIYDENYGYEPYLAFYNYEDYVEYEDEEILAPYEVELVSWEYPEPIENSLKFAGITRLTPSNIIPSAIVALVIILLCVIFVRKDREEPKNGIDKMGTTINYILTFLGLPFLCIVCALIDVNGSGDDILSQIGYCVPAITGLGLAASICLRRKGYSKTSFLVQFVGIALFIFVLIADGIGMFL